MCEHGTSTVVPTPGWLWDARAVPENGICIDSCIAPAIQSAWTQGVRTLGSCCGHDKAGPSVVLVEDHAQVGLAREHLPGFTLYQWRLNDVTDASAP
jgi:hypothetical protein